MKKIIRIIKQKLNRFCNSKRNFKLKNKTFTIISNNCYAGLTYQHLNLPYNSPTVGLYFFSDEYIRFVSNFNYYIKQDLKFIKPENSKYYDELKRLKQDNKIIGILDDVEIVFLHYSTEDEAKEKWTRRCERIDYDNLIFKFNDQNLSSYENLVKFDNLPYKHKICFVSKDYKDIKCRVYMKKYRNSDFVKDDAYFVDKYLSMLDYVNNNLVTDKKILHILYSWSFSGAENVACTIIDNFKDKYNMAYCSPNGAISETLKNRNINYYPMSKLSIKEIKRVIKEYNPDIIHAHDYTVSLLVALSSFKGKIISHLHNNCPFARTWNMKSILYYIFISKFYKIVGVSNKIYEEAIFREKMKSKFITIYNYVDKELVLNKSIEKTSNKKYDIFFIGRLTEQKDPLSFIRIINLLKKNNTNIKSVMIGDGELKEECVNKINELNLTENIELVGFQSNPFPIIKNSKIGIMPSKWEGFGLTAIESIILGKPVLNSGVGGLSEIFSNNKNLICNSDDEYVEGVNCILNDPRKYESELKFILNEYVNKDNWKEKVDSLYEEGMINEK